MTGKPETFALEAWKLFHGLKGSTSWNAWRSDPAIQEFAKVWISKPEGQWSEEDQQLSKWAHSTPDHALSVMFAVMQLTEDEKVLAGLGGGALEDFLSVQGESYVDIFHSLALEHKRLREALDNVWQGAMSKRVWHRIEILKQSAFS